jgi:membrane protein
VPDSPDGLHVAFLVPAENLTESDVSEPVKMLEDRGFHVDLVGRRSCEVQVLARSPSGKTEKTSLAVALTIDQVSAAKYQMVALPAALMHDGNLHAGAEILQFVRDMQAAGKPFICFPEWHPPQGASRVFALKQLLIDSWQNWNAIAAPRLGAALAYYTLLSFAPLVLLMVAIMSLVFPRLVVQSDILMPVRELMGNEAAALVQSVLDNARLAAGVIAGTISILILLVGASGVFLELRDSLDTVWGVKPRYGTGPWSLVRERVFAFLVILGAGAVLLIFLSLSTFLAGPTQIVTRSLSADTHLAQCLVTLASFIVMTFVFAFIYKVIPDVSISWSDVWIGASITSLLFTVGKILISLYLAKASIGSPYAAAGSIVVFLTWVYYSAQIFLLGAEFTHVYAVRHGSLANTAKPHATRKAHP